MKTMFLAFLLTVNMCTNTKSSVKTDDGTTIDVPVSIQKKVKELYPLVSEFEWEKNRKGTYEVEFISNGKEVELLIDKDANIIKSEIHIDHFELPKGVLDNLSKRGELRIARAIHIKEGNNDSYFVIGLTHTTRLKLLFDPNGKLLSETIIDRNKKPLIKAPLITSGVSSYTHKWELPMILTEISGFALIDKNTIICVQDELGVVYFYDLNKSMITREIPFSDPGDFEGITVVKNDAWVLRSDGKLYRIINFLHEDPKVEEHIITLPGNQNLEGLCYDKLNNRLLIAPREFDTQDITKKGIYAFDLTNLKFLPKPIFNIELNHSVFKDMQKKGKVALMPSEIAIHPTSGKIFITDARNAQVLILTATGEIEKRVQLNRSIFVKTEGISFTSSGELYLSNEGKKQNPTLLFLQKGLN